MITLPQFRRLLVCGALILASLVHAQNTVDPEGSVPANWTATGGTLSISPLHYKAGTQSLRWDWSAGSVLTVANPGITAADVIDFSKNTCDFWVWNGTAAPGGKLRVEFLNGATAQYWFDFYLDYTGWRRAVRSFTNDMAKKTSPSATFTSVRITVQANGAGSLFLDDFTWVGDRFTRIRDAQNPDITGASALTTCFSAYGVALDPVIPPTPTAAELAELNTIRSRWLAATKGTSTPSASSVTSAGTSFTALGIVEDANGIRGVPLGAFNPGLESWPLTLARDYAWGTSATKTASRDKVLQLARHLMDQGHVADSNTVPTEAPGPEGYSYRGLPNALILLAPAYDAATKAKMWEYFRWAYLLGDFWTDTWERNTDYVYLQSLQELGAILFLAPSDAEAVRQLKGYKRYMERFWVFSEGSEDGLKVDGTGFHHRSHYNNYMYAYGPVTNALYHLRGTGFQVDQPAYENLRLAFLAQMRMSADGTGTTGNTVGYFGNSLCGRKPFDTNITFSQAALQQLGELGGGFYGQSADPVVARAYNRRYGTGSYALFTSHGAETSPDGFHPFNYSPLGIYRRANWVASIRAPQRYFWSSEIFGDSNRYGRYQSYGALEILYHGGLAMSGQQLNGWDWNATPGSTTIVLPDAKLVAENGREDVRSQLNFSGALAFRDGQSGLYAANFQESNVGPNHNPSFVWRKSWFAFESQIVCLGSDIANNDAANPTATTLLQGALAAPSTALTLNGAAITAFPHSSTVSGATANWLLDPFGTGYLVQPGDDLRITRGTQTSANHDGVSAPTTGNFAKVWLDHGTAPTGARYEYAVFPGTTPAAMAAAATAHGNAATKPYQVIQHTTAAHVVKWKATGQIGYAIYATTALPAATQTAGLLRSVQRPCLVMTRLGAAREAWVSVVDPDLNFSNLQAAYGVPDASRARTLDFTVNGAWTLAADNPSATASIVSSPGATTTIRVTTQHGFAQHVHLEAATPPDVSTWANLGTDWTDPANWGGAWGGTAPANDPAADVAAFGAATVQPVLASPYAVKGITLDGGTILSGSGNLTLGSGGVVANGTDNAVSLANLTLQSEQTWNVGAGNLTVSSAIGGLPETALTKTGDGTLTLAGVNTYAGGLTIAQGAVILSGDQSGATGGIDQKAPGTSLFIGNTAQTATTRVVVGGNNSIAIGETVPSGAAARILSVSGSPAFATTVTNHGNLTVGRGALATVGPNASWLQNGPMRVAGVGGYGASLALTDGGGFAYAGPAGIELNPAADNSGNALLSVGNGATFTTSRGFVFGGAGNGTGTGQFTLSGQGVLRLSAAIADLFTGAANGSVRLGEGGGIIDTNGFSTTISPVLADSPGLVGSLRKYGAGTLALSGINTYTGSTTLTAGVLATNLLAAGGVGSGIGAGTGSSALVLDGGVLRYTGPANNTSPGWARGFTLGVNGGEFDLSAATGQLWIGGSLAHAGSGPRALTITTGSAGGRFGANLADGPGGASSLVKQGSGSLIVSGSNTYTGTLRILAGTVQYGNAGAGGESTGAGHSVVISSGASLSFRHANTAVTYNAPISGAGAVLMNYNNTSAGGALTLGGNNSFSGGLTISPSSGVNIFPLRAGSAAAFGSGHVTLGQYGTLDLNGFNNTIGLLVSAGAHGRVTNNGAADATLTLDSPGTQTYGGTLLDGTRTLGLQKRGAGRQILAGALTHTGNTTVTEGNLELAASGSLTFRPLANGVGNQLTVAAGATATLRGSFVVDLSGSTSTAGATWTLVSAAATTTTYADTFQVVGFTRATPTGGPAWTKVEGSRVWTFTETTGVLRLQTSGYAMWIAGFPALSDTTPEADPDGDGVPNLLEYVLGGDTLVPDARLTLPAASSAPEGVRLTFRRSDASESGTVTTVQYTTDLGSATVWTDLPIGAGSGGPDANGATYVVEENDDAPDLITVTVPSGATGRVFGRLRATTNP